MQREAMVVLLALSLAAFLMSCQLPESGPTGPEALPTGPEALPTHAHKQGPLDTLLMVKVEGTFNATRQPGTGERNQIISTDFALDLGDFFEGKVRCGSATPDLSGVQTGELTIAKRRGRSPSGLADITYSVLNLSIGWTVQMRGTIRDSVQFWPGTWTNVVTIDDNDPWRFKRIDQSTPLARRCKAVGDGIILRIVIDHTGAG